MKKNLIFDIFNETGQNIGDKWEIRMKQSIGKAASPGGKRNHVTWTDSLSIGIKELDDQHKGLIEFVNGLYDHASGNEEEERAYFKEVIQKAVQYIKTHFATEERYMVATKFPGYAEHKKLHDEFVMTVVNAAKDYDAGKRLVLVLLAHFLKDWILSHVSVNDMQYAQYFRSMATRKEDGKLSITWSDIK